MSGRRDGEQQLGVTRQLVPVFEQPRVDPAVFKDTIVFVGVSAVALHDTFVIVDEAQSLERNVLLTVLSRLGLFLSLTVFPIIAAHVACSLSASR